MQRTPRSFIKNVKERKNVAFFWKKRMLNPAKYPLVTSLDKSPIRRVKDGIFQVKDRIRHFCMSTSVRTCSLQKM